MVHRHHAFIFHRYGDMAPQWGHEFDLLRSRDVIGHVIIRLSGVDSLSVVHGDHASIWHRYSSVGLIYCDRVALLQLWAQLQRNTSTCDKLTANKQTESMATVFMLSQLIYCNSIVILLRV